MTNLHFFHPVERDTPTVMETIMKPLTFVRRQARWLVAAGIAVAAMPILNANAIELEKPDVLHPAGGAVIPFFEKTGVQQDCDTVTYRLRFGIRGDPASFANPSLSDRLEAMRMDLGDQIPAGLEIVDVQVSGDGTDAAGGAMPPAILGTTATPNDTLAISDFRLSATDLDGAGAINERSILVKITARIDQSAFPVPTIVDNQAHVSVSRPGGGSVDIPSHNPALPDDGDFTTGAATRITIDVTDCEPPPPPPPPGGDEACFKVETGDVDCVPGGGAYIYNMPVGADMAGKWIQVSTTTPGVTIAPGPQQVPAGGGVLNWTITGAGPGDSVHLIVTGIETYAGPEEGVGLCCTQTVDILIPPDLECPPEDGEPDIKVEKRADVANCTLEGGCDFTITVTNAGSAPYNGPIVLDEVTLPGNAAVESGPNAPWSCVPMVSPMSCTYPATTLNPGESIDLKLGFKPGPGWNWPGIRNCAEYDYTASGKGPFGDPANDKACASIPICIPGKDPECTPPEEKKADIGIRKSTLTPVCSADGVCLFRIDVINTGTSVINGPLTVVDEYPAGIPASSDFTPAPPWSCAPTGPGQFRCDHPGIVLVPGASTPIFVKTIVGDAFDQDQIENCAEVQPVPGETNLANNRSCATARIPNGTPGKPALRITKTCDGAVAGAAISCRITVSSVGASAPVGPVRVNDAATLIGAGSPVQIQTVTPDGAEWNCGAVPADTLACQIPGAVMTPGTSRHFDVTLSVAANQRFENCARGSYGPAPGDDIVYPFGEACDQGGSTITVDKTGDSQCQPGEACTFEITISNNGDTAFEGPVRIGDALAVEGLGRLEGVEISEIAPPFGCAPEPTTLPFSCVANLALEAGESRAHQVTVIIPDDGRLANQNEDLQGRNCVAVLSPDTPVTGERMSVPGAAGGGDEDGKAYSCHPFTIAKPTRQCSEGFVLNAAGRCVCPEGTTFRNGQCSGGATTVPVPTPKPRPTPRPKPKPTPPVVTPECPQGTTGRYPNCKPIVQRRCPQGTTGRYPNCKPIVQRRCPQGTTGRYPNCKPIVQRRCPQGTTGRYPNCKPIVQRRCPQGTTGRYPNCKPIVQRRCPQGTTGRYPNCKPIVQRQCPKGTTGRYPNCKPIVQRRCPQGTTGRYPNCKPIRKQPGLQINPDILKRVVPQRAPNTNNNSRGLKLQ